MLSQVERVIEAAIAQAIPKTYKFSGSQLVFRTVTGTEMAIRRHISNSKTLKLAAFLDLTSAYDPVSRKLLLKIATRSLPADLLGAVSFVLQPIKIQTQGKPTRKTDSINSRVSQGSLLSPTLFNLYMDTLSRQLAITQRSGQGH